MSENMTAWVDFVDWHHQTLRLSGIALILLFLFILAIWNRD